MANNLAFVLAANFLTSVNEIMTDYAVPLVGLCMIIAAVTGLIKNWEAINDNTASGRRKEGIINTLYIIGYVLLVIAIIAAVKLAISRIDLTLS